MFPQSNQFSQRLKFTPYFEDREIWVIQKSILSQSMDRLFLNFLIQETRSSLKSKITSILNY